MSKLFYYSELEYSDFQKYHSQLKSFQFLKEVKIEFRNDYQNDADFRKFFNMMPNLQNLWLQFNDYRFSINFICNLGNGLIQLHNLSELVLQFSSLGNKDIIKYALEQTMGIKSLKKLVIQLKIQQNQQIEHIQTICHHIKSQVNLEKLDLIFYDNFDYDINQSEICIRIENYFKIHDDYKYNNENLYEQQQGNIKSKYVKIFQSILELKYLKFLKLELFLNKSDINCLGNLIQRLVKLEHIQLVLKYEKQMKNGNILDIVKAFKYMKNLQSLIFILNKNILIKEMEFIELTQSIKQLTKLNKLHFIIQEGDLRQQLILNFEQCLSKLTNLNEFYLDLASFSTSSLIEKIFGKKLKNLNIQKITLNLCSDISCFKQSQVYLRESFHLWKLQQLQLNIFNYSIGEHEASQIGQSMKCMFNLQKLKINISQSNIKQNISIKLGEGIQYLINLTHLKLKTIPENDYDDFKQKFLNDLTQNDNQDEENNQLVYDIDGFFKFIGYLQNLRKLSLIFIVNSFTATGYSQFGKEIQTLQKLEKVNFIIQGIEILQKNFQAVISGFKHLNNLKSLAIYVNFNCLQIMSEEIQQFQRLKNLDFHTNNLSYITFDESQYKVLKSFLQVASKTATLITIKITNIHFYELSKYYFKVMKRNAKRLVLIEIQKAIY